MADGWERRGSRETSIHNAAVLLMSHASILWVILQCYSKKHFAALASQHAVECSLLDVVAMGGI